jgi:hypothetical protein
MTSSRSRSQVLLGHKKLDTTPLYTRVAISAIGEVTSPLDLLLKDARLTRRRCHGQRLPVVLVVHENRGLNPHVATGLTRRITG